MVLVQGFTVRWTLMLLVVVFMVATHFSTPVRCDEMKELRKQAASRTRRIIFNNDGDDSWKPTTRQEFLDLRTTPLLGTHVDTIFYSTGQSFAYFSHNSRACEVNAPDGTMAARFIAQGTDNLEVMIDFCRQNGIEIFWSMRMNDTHDSATDHLMCQWKKDHPDYMVGKKGQKQPYGCNRWSSVDYGLGPVRDKVYRIFEDVCTRYDVDGIEMDFFRHPVLFRPQMTGEPVTQEHCDMLTGLVRRIREMTERVGLERGRPVLIAARLFDSIGYCNALGIDLIRWLDEDLVDVLTGGGYFKFEPWQNWAAFGEKYDVPAYACLVSRRLMSGGEPEAGTALKIWRGEAYNAWKAGVDGIYTFNRFDPRDPIFRELGDPNLLETLERIDQESYVGDFWSKPEKWLKGGRAFVKDANATQ